MFLVSVTRILYIIGKSTVMESIFSKVTGKISSFYNSLENSITFIGMLRKAALLEILRNSLSTRVAGLQSTGCNTFENELLTKFLEGIWKFFGKFPGRAL